MNSTIVKNTVLILGESVSIERVKSLINHPDVIEKDIKLLKSYLKNYNKELKKIMVSYSKKGCGIGRRYAQKSLSLQNFNRNIRQSLVYDTHSDIDIKNCGLKKRIFNLMF
jgi:midasin (ATPase involved in ribosome maturation)